MNSNSEEKKEQLEGINAGIKAEDTTVSRAFGDVSTTESSDMTKYPMAARIIAVVLLAVGFIYNRFVMEPSYFLGATIAVMLLYVCGGVIVAAYGGKPSLRAVLLFASGFVMSISLLFTANETVSSLVKAYATVAYFISIYYAYGNYISKKTGSMFAFEAIKSIFVMPFLAISSWGRAVFGKRNGAKFKRSILLALCGLFIAVVPSFIVIMLLSYDDGFTAILNSISFSSVARFIGDAIFAVVFTLLVFSQSIASAEGRGSKIMTEEACFRFSVKAKALPSVAVVSFVLPLLAVYGTFFVSQWDYYVSAFTGILPEGFVYSQYARDGFFQLCTVAGINAAVILLAELFAERPFGKRTVPVKIVTLLMSLSTLALIATALSKMIMYIDIYGLTRLRVYTTWFMIFMSIGFVIIIVSQFAKKVRLVPSLFAVACVMIGVMAFAGVDGQIAKYNKDAFLSGKLDKFDVQAASELSAEAVPHVLSLLDCDIEDGLREDILAYGAKWASKDEMRYGFFGYSVAMKGAKDALEKYGEEYDFRTPTQAEDVAYWFTIIPDDQNTKIVSVSYDIYTADGRMITSANVINASGDILLNEDPIINKEYWADIRDCLPDHNDYENAELDIVVTYINKEGDKAIASLMYKIPLEFRPEDSKNIRISVSGLGSLVAIIDG